MSELISNRTCAQLYGEEAFGSTDFPGKCRRLSDDGQVLEVLDGPRSIKERKSTENPKAAFGNLKTPTLSVIPSPPLLQVGEVMRRGAEKYGAYNWRESRVNTSTYIDAAMRHLMSYQDGETIDPDDGQSHLAHAAASLFVIMDALAVGNATDDRPKPGVAAEFIAAQAAKRVK